MGTKSFEFNKELIEQSRYARSQDFHGLMRWRIRNILLVSSLYDSYIFEEEGRLYELIRQEYKDLNLNHPPELIQVSSGEDALEMAKDEDRFDLIIVTIHIEGMSAVTFSKKVKEAGINLPIILLGYDNKELVETINHPDSSVFENIFMWQGDFRIVLGITKYLEDKLNVDNDTENVGVQSIILIEDDIRFYSSYLPLIYTEILQQAHGLIHESVNLQHKFLRMRARTKILLCHTYEEAEAYLNKYEEYILGIISDVDFSKNGKSDKEAGFKFAAEVKKRKKDIPVLLQSNENKNQAKAKEKDMAFILKQSPTLHHELRDFIKLNFGFGEFKFKNLKDEVVGVARNLKELETELARVPPESVKYHAERNHFSIWLKARTEFWLANQLRPQKVTDFETVDDLRDDIIEKIKNFRKSRRRSVITDFDISQFESRGSIMRVGGGSIGGKARGLGFINNLIYNFDIPRKFKNVSIFVPSCVILATEIFDKFLWENQLRDFALHCEDDDEIIDRFIKADKFPYEAIKDLATYLEKVMVPLAVRSSSLLEDSQGQPFAGVYDTYMVPNNNQNLEIRLHQVLNKIKMVYASTFLKKTKDYIKVTSYRLEEEKMAVIIQSTVGAEHNNKYYPEFSGVAKSYNFYPTPPMTAHDGIASVALGLGKIIVDGGPGVRFCPRFPNNNFQFATVDDYLKYTQKEFYALTLDQRDEYILDEDEMVKPFDVYEAYKDGTLSHTGSSYSHDNNAIYDGVSRDGVRMFTMAPILKFSSFPLSEILELLLKMGSWGMSAPVEIEFAVNMSTAPGRSAQFGILQMRPLMVSEELEELDIDKYEPKELLCRSDKALGNGLNDTIYDIVYVDFDKFDRGKSVDVAHEIDQFNSKLIHAERPYLLIGVGRWGTMDHWLGIPVRWEQISGAKGIIEANFKDFSVSPSQGSHFFQNLTAFKIGYFTVDPNCDNSFVDWDWLAKHKHEEEKEYARHIRLDKPVTVMINGQQGRGIILKPGDKETK